MVLDLRASNTLLVDEDETLAGKDKEISRELECTLDLLTGDDSGKTSFISRALTPPPSVRMMIACNWSGCLAASYVYRRTSSVTPSCFFRRMR